MDWSFLTGLLNFTLYYGIALVLLVVFKFIYTWITPHDEWALIKEEKNTAAAIAFGGAIIGFAIALGGAATNSVSIADFILWAIVALGAQILAFGLVRFVFMPKIISRIKNDEISAAVMLCAISIAAGILNAACMSY
ncbi:DUF350 domain-containing protein [Desulfosediminicola sp.]|uniref:DUF350 domain-containing protein n=1 Tax=Desulfosediminicola sp. TaxID=2886825 RepID=UPI003AF2F84F